MIGISMKDPRVDEVYSQIKKVVTEVLKVSEEKIRMESRYIEDFGANSLDRLTLIVQLENEFEFTSEIPEEDTRELISVGATVEYILHRMESSGR